MMKLALLKPKLGVVMKMTTFYLVRHGIKEKAIGDVPLSEYGIEQAQMTAAYLESKLIKHVYASPLRRAKETAEFIGSRLGLPVLIDNRLRERANWGDLAGQTFQEFVDMWERCSKDRQYVPPVGNSSQQAGERLESFAVEISEANAISEIVAVAHGGLITDFLINVIPPHELMQWHPRFIEVQSDLVPECSITRIEYIKGRYHLIQLADITHLKKTY